MARPSLLFLDFSALLEPVEKFTNEVKRITAVPYLSITEKMTMVREAGNVLSRELEDRIQTFTEQLEERKKELQKVMFRPDLVEQMRHVLMEMSALVRKVELRDELTKTWESESPEGILQAYENSIAAGETVTVEMFEAYAEDILERKSNVAALAAFRERRDSRLARMHAETEKQLQELEQLGTALQAILSVVASALQDLEASTRAGGESGSEQ